MRKKQINLLDKKDHNLKNTLIRSNTLMAAEAIHWNYDTLLHVFGYLDQKSLCRCSMVCRSWKQAAYHKSLWSGRVFEVPSTGLTDQAALSLKDHGVSATSINQDWQHMLATSSDSVRYPYDWYYGEDRCTRWKIQEPRRSVFQASSQKLTELLRSSVQIMHAKSIILLDSPLRFDMTSGINFTTLRNLCLINSDIDLDMLINTLHLMSNLVQLYINNKNRYAESNHPWRKKDKRRFNGYNAFQDIIRSQQNLLSLELVSIDWSISFNPRSDLSFGLRSKVERLVLNDTLCLDGIHLAQVANSLQKLKHLHLKYELQRYDSTMSASFLSLESLTVQFEDPSLFESLEDQNTNCFAIFRDAPNLTALYLRNSHRQKDTDQSCVIRHVDIDIMVGLFPFLKVVNVSGCRHVGDESLIKLLEKLQHLEVLVALDSGAVFWNSDSVMPTINPKNLVSFLVKRSPSWIVSLKGLKYRYVSYENTKGGVFRKNDNHNHWNWVNEGSKHWKEAHGWSYFHLPDEFDFSSRYDTPQTMLDLSAEKDKDRQKLCMWDI